MLSSALLLLVLLFKTNWRTFFHWETGIMLVILALSMMGIGFTGWLMFPDDNQIRIFVLALVGAWLFGLPGIRILIQWRQGQKSRRRTRPELLVPLLFYSIGNRRES